MAGRIYVVGDTHGILDSKKVTALKESENLDYEDYVIICGDAGIVWDKDLLEESILHYENLKTNILFVDGNHENFDMLNAYPQVQFMGGKVHKISNHITHLMRGQVFTIFGKKFLTIGGASSHDKNSRIKNVSWWEEEEISYSDILEAFSNLERCNFEVDYVISHAQPTSTLKELVEVLTVCGEDIPYFLKPKLEITLSNELLEEVKNKIKFKHWFSGHLHIDEELTDHSILYTSTRKIYDNK